MGYPVLAEALVRGWIYDLTLVPLTSRWYRTVLERLARGARLLDVGIGTGGALARNASTVRARQIRITGLDIDPDYVKRCRRQLARARLEPWVEVRLESIYHHVGGPYDAVYFSGSFMLMPDPAGALRHVRDLLAPGGEVLFTQTFQERRSPLIEKAKPHLHRVTTIRFGSVTYEADFLRVAESAGLEIVELTTLSRRGQWSGRLAVGRARAAALSHDAETVLSLGS